MEQVKLHPGAVLLLLIGITGCLTHTHVHYTTDHYELSSLASESVTDRTDFHIPASTPKDDTKTNTPEPNTTCHVVPRMAIGKPGGAVEFHCVCPLSSKSIPEWRGVNNVVHYHEKHETDRVASLRLLNVSLSSPKTYTCVDIFTNEEQGVGKLEISKSQHGGFCSQNHDCMLRYICKESKCRCRISIPVFIPGSSEVCYSESRLNEPCSYRDQCTATVKNSYCNFGTHLCDCKGGFEQVLGTCQEKGSTIILGYTVTRKNQVLWWLLFSTITLIICITFLRLIMLRRRSPRQERLISVSSQGETAQTEYPEIQGEKPKLRF